ncbi:MAG: energy-coupled thiamine transporter ThiT [Clostridiaceae bacterium]|nr:energy-coupled thiamine transporter ThiT [Clostridiaceae bacterium]
MFEKLFELKPEVLVVLSLLIILAVVLSYLGRNRNFKFDTKIIVYGSLCVALSFVLSYIRIYRFPQGGSITPAAMLPLILYAVMFGPLPGIIAGFAFGMLRLMQDPYIIHWAQFFLDYPLAYGALGLAGFYRKNLAVSCVLAGFGRFLMSFLSGVLFFGIYAPEGMNVWLYSLTVNGIGIGVNTLICIVIAFLPQIQSAIKQIQRAVPVDR